MNGICCFTARIALERLPNMCGATLGISMMVVGTLFARFRRVIPLMAMSCLQSPCVELVGGGGGVCKFHCCLPPTVSRMAIRIAPTIHWAQYCRTLSNSIVSASPSPFLVWKHENAPLFSPSSTVEFADGLLASSLIQSAGRSATAMDRSVNQSDRSVKMLFRVFSVS